MGSQLTCVFVDHGLMRKNEGDEVEAAFSKWDIHFVRVDAEARFLEKLSGVSESTVVRFASELGYDGYPSMQRALQEMIRSKLTSIQRIESPTTVSAIRTSCPWSCSRIWIRSI